MDATVTDSELMKVLRAERRRLKRRKTYAKIAGDFVVYAIVLPIRALWLMVAVGVAHAEWIRSLPTIGYWWSMVLVSLLAGVFSPFGRKDKNGGEET